VLKINKFFIWLVGLILLMMFIISTMKIKQTFFSIEQLPLAGKVIVIDPGHGGLDGGAVADDGEKTEEKRITLEVAKMTRHYLEQAGAIVYLTRETDKDLADDSLRGLSKRKSQDIRRRIEFIHDKHADLFISIHLNSLSSQRWRGAQSFFYPRFQENKQLATSIQDEIILNMENTNRVALQLNGIYLLKHAKVPGALVELGFLSNKVERELLKETKYQQQLAASIYKGVLAYVENPRPNEESE